MVTGQPTSLALERTEITCCSVDTVQYAQTYYYNIFSSRVPAATFTTESHLFLLHSNLLEYDLEVITDLNLTFFHRDTVNAGSKF